MPSVRLPPGFSHSELVIQVLTVCVAPLHTPQPPRLCGGCSGDGEKHACSRLRALGVKPAMLQSCCNSQFPGLFGQWGCHSLPWGHLGP